MRFSAARAEWCKLALAGIRYETMIPEGFVPRRVLDLGAQEGAFACWAARRFPRAWIDLEEPDPELRGLAMENAPPGTKAISTDTGVARIPLEKYQLVRVGRELGRDFEELRRVGGLVIFDFGLWRGPEGGVPAAAKKGPTIAATGYWDGRDAHLHHAHSAPLAAWIAGYLHNEKDRPLYDFGCGTGAYLQILREHGFTHLVGFEGDPPKCAVCTEPVRIYQQDLTRAFMVPKPGNVVCLEVGEHIPAELESVFLDNLTRACDRHLILSWAVRGQGGDGHVNCRDNPEVIANLERRGFQYIPEQSKHARLVIGDKDSDLPWFKDTLLIFRKKSS